MAATEIPADRPSVGPFVQIHERVLLRTRAILEDAAKSGAKPGTDAQRIGDFYASFMDEAAIESKGIAPLKPMLDGLSKLGGKKALAKELGAQLRVDVDPLNNTKFHTTRLFGLWVEQDFNQPTRAGAYLLQGGLGMPDRSYYLDAAPRMEEIRTKYKAYLTTLFKLAGVAQPDARAARVFELEKKIAAAHATRTDSEDVKKANNPWLRKDFATKAPGLDWELFFAAAHLDKQESLIVWHPQATTGLAALVASEPLSTWKEYLQARAIDRAAPLLPKAFVEARFGFYGTVLRGTPKARDRWKEAIDLTNEALRDEVGKAYVALHFRPQYKAEVQGMVDQIVSAFGRRIDALDWMAPETRSKAKAKLAALRVGIAYPERWRDTAGLEIVRGDAIGNYDRAERFGTQQELAKIGKPMDRGEWVMAPQTVNAVNLPVRNALNFPAAIFEPPFYVPEATLAVKFGAIGAVIGHEISHSFDDQGAMFDATGRLANWWTEVDLKHFEHSGAALVAQFEAYHPLPDAAVNGKQTLSENIADLAGLAAAYDGWRTMLAGSPAPITADGYSGDQQFFISFAQSWASKMREPALRQRLLTDGHAPGQYRAWTVRNMDAWYAAFDVKPSDAMFLEPKSRVRVW